MHLVIRGIPTGKMVFEIGNGGDGKGMESILDSSLFGEDNFATLDCGIFTDRMEFRKSCHFGWNKRAIRIQEFTKSKSIVSDIWKRFISGEPIDSRVNYGFTAKLSFGMSMKIQELNFENIPVIEEKSGNNLEYCNQLKRRVICAIVGKGTLVHDEDQVDRSAGRFLYIPQDELVGFLSDPLTASLYFKLYCIPFFKKYSVTQCKNMVNNLSLIDPQLETDTVWLAKNLSGVKEYDSVNLSNKPSDVSTQQMIQDHEKALATEMIEHVHSAMPENLRLIKPYLITLCPYINVPHGREKGKKGTEKTKKILKFE